MTTSDKDSPNVASRLIITADSTELRRISRIYDTVDGPDSPDLGGGGRQRRQRHPSGLGFELLPLGDSFTGSELAAYLQPLVDKKIRTSKIYQHLTSYETNNGVRVRNYPAIDTKSIDTGSGTEILFIFEKFIVFSSSYFLFYRHSKKENIFI